MTTLNRFSWWKRITIHTKLQVVVTGFAILILLFGALLLGVGGRSYINEKVQRDLMMLAQVMAENSKAALLFKDEKSAFKVLSALHGNPNIEAAAIIENDKIFSIFPLISMHPYLIPSNWRRACCCRTVIIMPLHLLMWLGCVTAT